MTMTPSIGLNGWRATGRLARNVGLGGAVLLAAATGMLWAQDRAEQIAVGKRLFVDQGCIGCHTVERMGTPIAPDLSRVGAKYPGRDLEEWLADPRKHRPHSHMPRIQLTETEVRLLAAYLRSLR
jgi:mono/diheme cytochrome c family protein